MLIKSEKRYAQTKQVSRQIIMIQSPMMPQLTFRCLSF